MRGIRIVVTVDQVKRRLGQERVVGSRLQEEDRAAGFSLALAAITAPALPAPMTTTSNSSPSPAITRTPSPRMMPENRARDDRELSVAPGRWVSHGENESGYQRVSSGAEPWRRRAHTRRPRGRALPRPGTGHQRAPLDGGPRPGDCHALGIQSRSLAARGPLAADPGAGLRGRGGPEGVARAPGDECRRGRVDPGGSFVPAAWRLGPAGSVTEYAWSILCVAGSIGTGACRGTPASAMAQTDSPSRANGGDFPWSRQSAFRW